jgi:hypothetical protein
MTLDLLHTQADILCEILGYLEQKERLQSMTLVSRQFRYAVYNSIDTIRLRGEDSDNVQEILSNFPCLKKLELAFCKSLTNDVMAWILDKYTKLINLTIIHCVNLTELIIPDNNLVHLEVKDSNHINKVSITCTRLEYLNLSGCSGFTHDNVDELLRFNNKLKTVVLRRVNHLLSLNDLYARNLESLSLERCKNLKSINFKFVPVLRFLDVSYTSICDHDVYLLMENLNVWNAIQEIKFDGCKLLRAPVINNSSVKKLSFDFCANLERPSLETPALQWLSMNHTNVVDHALESAIRYNEKIITLHARNNLRIVRPKIPATQNHNIEELDLRGCHWMESIDFPTIASPTRLRKMDLSWTRISDETLYPITRDCVALRDLFLRTCDFLVDPFIESQSIEMLDLTGAHALTSPIIRCSNMKEMRVENCTNLDVQVREMVEQLMDLKLRTPPDDENLDKKVLAGTGVPCIRRRLALMPAFIIYVIKISNC